MRRKGDGVARRSVCSGSRRPVVVNEKHRRCVSAEALFTHPPGVTRGA